MPYTTGNKEWTYKWTKPFKHNLARVYGGEVANPMRYLEIGVFEGRSMYIVKEKFFTNPDSELVGIDPWDVEQMKSKTFPRSEEGRKRMETVESRARRNLSEYENVKLLKGRSFDVLKNDLFPEHYFDLIYIDGAHYKFEIMQDCIVTWPLLACNGVAIWDDYKMQKSRNVKKCVDLFLQVVDGEYEELFCNHQMGVRKTKRPESQGDHR